MPRPDIPKPSYATRNMRIIGHTDQGGRGDGQQVMVKDGYAYVGHVCSRGFSIFDVRDPTRPKAVTYIENPPNTWSLHIQVHDDLLLQVQGRDMFTRTDMADERNYYKPKAGDANAPAADAKAADTKNASASISSGNADIDHIVVTDKVYLTSGTQTATADNGSFDMAKQLFILKGDRVVLTDGPNVFTGCQLTVHMETGQAQLESCGGRVQIQLDPKSQKQN